MHCVRSRRAEKQLVKHQRSNQRAYKAFSRVLALMEAAPSLPVGRQSGLDIKKVHTGGGFRIKQDGIRVLFEDLGAGEIEVTGLVLKGKGTYKNS